MVCARVRRSYRFGGPRERSLFSEEKSMSEDKKNATSRETREELDIEYSQQLQWVLDGHHPEFGIRSYALDFWQQIAAGNHDIETRIFIEAVAHDLLRTETLKQYDRQQAIIKAVRLTGSAKRDQIDTANEIERANMFNEFSDVTKKT